jgi:hypothetical protein
MTRFAKTDRHLNRGVDPFHLRERAHRLRGAHIALAARRLGRASSPELAAPGAQLRAQIGRPFTFNPDLRAFTFHRF